MTRIFSIIAALALWVSYSFATSITLTGAGLFRTPTPYSATSSAPNGLNSLSGYTFFNREFSLLNNATINTVGINSATAGSMKIKIVLRNSATSYTVVVDQTVTHGGTGWEDFTLTTPYVVPASGTYYVGEYQALGPAIASTGAVPRAFVNVDITGTNNSITESVSDASVVRVSGTQP